MFTPALSDWDLFPSAGIINASPKSLAQPFTFNADSCFPTFSTNLDDIVFEESLGFTDYFGLSQPFSSTSSIYSSQAAVPNSQLFSSTTNSINNRMVSDGTSNLDGISPCTEQMGTTPIGHVLRPYSLSVSGWASPVPSLCSSHGSSNASGEGAAASTPNEESPKPSNSVSSPVSGKSRHGRPRKPRTSSSLTHTHNNGGRIASRDSKNSRHSEVERKYRQNLNAALKRLQDAVPALSQLNLDDIQDIRKISKVTLLDGAIDYINELKGEQVLLTEESRRLLAHNIRMRIDRDVLKERLFGDTNWSR